MKQLWLRRMAAVTALALVAAACGNGDDEADEPVEETETEEVEEEDDATEEDDDATEDDAAAGDDDVLNLGYILPESGPLAFLGPPQIESVNLAVEEINAAGGVLGNDVTLSSGDEAGDATIAAETANRLVGEGVNAIVGAAATGMSLAFVDAITSAGVLQCSASNTGLTFTNADYNGLYFRTAPSDILQGPVLAETIIGDGNSNPALLARADDYGQGLLGATVDALEAQGATIAAEIVFDPEAANFDAEVNQVAGSGADSVVLITFDEGAQILQAMVEQGFGPSDIPVYGADGIRSNDLAGLVDPSDESVLDGMRGTAPGAPPSDEVEDTGYLGRFTEETGLDDTTFAAEAYDCTVIIALAAQLAGSVQGEDIAAEMVNVTAEGGTECTSYAECIELFDAGEDFTYLSAAGVTLTLTDTGNGEPDRGFYEVWEIDDTGAVNSVDNVESTF